MWSPGCRDAAPLWHGPLPRLSVPEYTMIWHRSLRHARTIPGNLPSWLSSAVSLVLRGSANASLVVIGAAGNVAGGDAGGQAQWQLSGSGALALSKKGANLIAVCISREHKSVFAFQGCVRALCADYIQCSGCCTDAPKKQPWSGEVIIKEHLAERWVCECPDGNCKPCSSPNPVSRLLEADVLLSGGS